MQPGSLIWQRHLAARMAGEPRFAPVRPVGGVRCGAVSRAVGPRHRYPVRPGYDEARAGQLPGELDDGLADLGGGVFGQQDGDHDGDALPHGRVGEAGGGLHDDVVLRGRGWRCGRAHAAGFASGGGQCGLHLHAVAVYDVGEGAEQVVRVAEVPVDGVGDGVRLRRA